MSDYLTRLAARALGTTEVARPRRSIFAPRRGAPEPLTFELEGERVEAEAPAETPERTAEPAPPPAQAAPGPRRPRNETPAPEAEGEPPPAALPRRTSGPPRRRAQPVPATEAEAAASLPAGREPTAPERPPELGAARPDAADRRPSTRAPAQGRAEPPPLLTARPPTRPALRVKDESSPTVRVTIGRVDVRAVAAEQQPKPKPTQKGRPAPRMSLDEYLSRARRDGG